MLLYTVHLPVYPYVKKYLESRFGEGDIALKKSNKILKIIYLALERMPVKCETYPDFGDSIKIRISRDFFERKGLYISRESVYLINDIIADEIFDEVFNYLYNVEHNIGIKKYDMISISYYTKAHSEKKLVSKKIKCPDIKNLVEIKNAIEDILKKYQITFEDLTFESLHRAYFRYKKRINYMKAS